MAVIRKLSGWDLGKIIDEYKTYAEPKIRDCDIQYITGFDLSTVSGGLSKDNGWSFRARNSIRVTLFTLLVLLVWIWSGNKMASQRPLGPAT